MPLKPRNEIRMQPLVVINEYDQVYQVKEAEAEE